MIRKMTLTAVTVALALLALALPALAALTAAPERFGWDLQLRNAKTPKYGADMTYKQFAVWAAKKHRRVTIVDGATAYRGVSLKTLVGYFDDNNRETFNAALARKGYSVVILGMDGYTATFPSALIAQLGDKVIVADLADGAALPVPAAYLDEGGLPVWTPEWPLRVVSLDPVIIAAEMDVRGVMRLSIVKAAPPTAAPERFGWDLQLRNTLTAASAKYDADMTYGEFPAWAAKKHRRVTIVDGATTYRGVSLKTLVGYFDDGNRETFNAALARKGYSVVITGFDGFAQTWASADIARLGAKVILADLADGAALPVPPAFLDGAGLPVWMPDWPLRVVSVDPGVVYDMKVQGVARLSIEPAAPTGVARF